MATPLNILIIEDSVNDAALLVHELRAGGFDPEWKRVDTEADFRASLGPHLNIILSDFSLPQFSVQRALALLQESKLGIPFIIVSGTIGEERAVESVKSGVTDYVLKDRLERLVVAVRRALRETQERAERRRAEEALRASEERFRQLAENINEVFWITDPAKTQMLYISPAFETIWGRTCESLYQAPRAWIDAIHPDDQQRVQEAVLTKQTRGEYDETYRIIRPDGSLRWIHDRAFPIRNAADEVYRVVGTAEDITKQHTLEDQFRQAQKMESVGQLAGGVAHDFNNILTVIQGHVYLLLSDPSLTEQNSEAVDQIALAAERAASLTRQLLTFSRKQTMKRRMLDLNEVVGNMTKMLQRVLGEDICLQVNPGSNLPMIHADPGMMEQVIMNLAVNARDAMPSGGQLIIRTFDQSISLDYLQLNAQAAPGDHVGLAVSDTGSGISPEVLPRIFEPFFTTKAVGKGTGLGLAMVYGIIRQHHGWITVDSEVGKGTVFRIYLPVMAWRARGEAERVTEREVRGGTETILLVEDEGSVRALVQNLLERYGYKVVEAASGLAALRVWRERMGQVDLLLTDMIMPDGVTGRELVENLHAEKPSLPAIYTSGYSADVVGKDFMLQDGLNFLQKPYSPTMLAQTVRNALDRVTAKS